MNKEKLNELLDSVYELEGLIHLALGRDDNPEHLCELISRKGKAVAEMAASEPSPAVEEAVIAENFDSSFCMPDAPCPQDLIDSEARMESEAIDEIVEEMARESMHNSASESDRETISETIKESAPESVNEEAVRGKLVFTLNDRFRFKRELFGNSDADFNNTLALVASMENYDEAEDYFLNELQWDPAREDVKDFLDILKKYFK